jgi:L-threonylcarbamoyladenylate synthase
METRLAASDTPAALDSAVAAAVVELRAGQPVGLPTETVYGLAADALRREAVMTIFEAKERPLFDPLIVHLPDRGWLERIAAIPDESRALVNALIAEFWPGPLTLVLPRRAIVPDLVTSGMETVAVRMSAHPVFRAVLTAFERPLAAPSANRFGRISPTTAAHVQSELAGRIPLIVDGGPTEHGLESTIVKVDGVRLTILRAGPVTIERLAAFGETERGGCGVRPQAPGQLKSHYAPRTPLRLLEHAGHPARSIETNWQPSTMRVGLLAEGPIDGEDYARFFHVEWLSETGDLREAAATLFAKLRRLDDAGLELILAEPVPEQGLGIAIMDRLRKAAAAHA